MDFHGMKRKQLQSLCKKHGIPANLRNVEMADRLSSVLKEVDKPEGGEQSSLADPVDIEPESDLKDLPQRVKKVRFSPENETFIFISSDTESTVVKKRLGRRKHNKKMQNSNLVTENSEEVEDSVKNSRVHSANARKTRVGRAAEITNRYGKPTTGSESNSGRELTRRQLRSRGAVVVKENQEDGLEKNLRKRYLEKGGDCNSNAIGRLMRQSKPAMVESKLGRAGRVTRSKAKTLDKVSTMNERNEDVAVQVEGETRNVIPLGEPPRGLARKTQNSIALSKGSETVVGSDAVRGRKFTLRSSCNEEKAATILTDEKVNRSGAKKNTKKRSSNLAAEEVSTEYALGFGSVNCKLFPRRSRRKNVMSRLLTDKELSGEKMTYSPKLQKPITKVVICDNQSESSGGAQQRAYKRNSWRVSADVSKKMMSKAANKRQQGGSRMVSAEVVAAPESEISMTLVETMNLNPDSCVSQIDLSKEVLDCIQGKESHIKAQKAEKEHVAFESDKSLVIEHTHPKTVPSEENEEQELFPDIGEDNLTDVDSLRKDSSAKVNDLISYEFASPMNRPCECSYIPFNLEGVSGTEPSIEEQETCAEEVEVGDHLASGSINPIGGIVQNFLSEESAHEEQIEETKGNRDSDRNSEDVVEETEEKDHLDCNSAEEVSVANQATKLQDSCSGLTPALYESRKGVNQTKCQSISCSALRGKMHLEEDESAAQKTDLPWKIPYGGKIDSNAAMEIKDDEMQKVQKASIATEDAADKGVNEDCQIAENGDSGPTVVSSAEGNVSPKSGSSVALNEPINVKFNILEVAVCECEPVIDSREVTDSIQGKQSRIELGAGKQLSSVDSNAQNMKEDGRDAIQSDKSPVSEQMDSKAVLSKANGRGEMIQDASEDKSDGIPSLHEDKLFKHVQAHKLFSPGRCSETEQFVVKQEISEINTKSVGLLAAGSFDSMQGSGQNSPLLELGLKEQIKNVTEDKRLETNSGDIIKESDETNYDGNSKRETDVAMEERTLPDKLLTVEVANTNGEIAEEETHEASEKDAEAPMYIIEKVVTECSKNEDTTMIISTSKNGAANEKCSGAIVPMQDEGVCKDEILVVETEGGKSNQIQNEEEMFKEENEKENMLNFGRKSSDSLEEVWQTDGRPNPFSVTGSELQSKEDIRAVILTPLEDNQVDEGENAFYGVAYKLCQDKDSVSNNEDVNAYEVQNDEEMITEDGLRNGLKFGGESTDVLEESLHEDFPAAPRNVGNVLSSSHEHVVSPKEDAHEDEKDKADREQYPDSGKADNGGVQVALSGERRWNLTNVDSNSSIFPSDVLSKLRCPDHPRRICSGCETFDEFHGTETTGEAPPTQNFTARANIMDYEILEQLHSKTEIAQLNNSEDTSSSKISLTVGVTVEEKTVRLTESPEMDQRKGFEQGETGLMALILCSDKNTVTSSAGPELSGAEIANAGESGESTERAAVSADSISVSNNSYSGMNISSIEVCGTENMQFGQSTSISLNELIVGEKGNEHELPLNGVESDCQWNEENVFAEYSSFTHTMLNINTDTQPNPEEKEDIQTLGVQMALTVTEDGGNLNNGLQTCGQFAAEEFMGDETAAEDQFRDDETDAKGSTVKEQISLMTKSYGGPRTVGTAGETSYGVFAFTADSSLKRGRETNFSAISQVRTSTDCENGTSCSDLQLFTSQEVSLFFGEGKVDAPEELSLEAEADSAKVVMGIGDKSCEKNLAALSPMYSKYEYLEIENVEAEPIFHHEKEEVLTTKDDVPTAAAEQLTCEATEGTMKEQEDDAYAMIREYIDIESERDALTEMESTSLSVNEPLEKCDWNILTNESNATSSVKSAGFLVSSDETEHRDAERKNEVFKINDIAPSESSLKKMNLRTPRKLPSAFDMMKENILKNTKRERFDGSATAGKTSMKGRKALEELQMNQS